MFSVAARVLSDQVTQDDLDLGRIFPSLSQIREVSLNIAAAVAKIAFDRGLAGIEKPDDTRGFIKSCMYDPTYPEYTR
jgi:malate dehydrogenase (oxaloacetate-decarboxylating)(NADP+)